MIRLTIIIKYNIVLVLMAIASHANAQADGVERFPFQQFFSQGLTTFNGEFLGEFVGDEPSQVCSQITPDILEFYSDYPRISADGRTQSDVEVGNVELQYFAVNINIPPTYGLYCSWPIIFTHTDLLGISDPFVEETSKSATVQRLCQRRDTGNVPSGAAQLFRAPSINIRAIPGDCSCPESYKFDTAEQWCVKPLKDVPPDKNLGPPCDSAASPNPCHVGTGNKYRSEADITSGALTFSRSYNSQALTNVGMGLGWRGSHDKFLQLGIDRITVSTPSGRAEVWRKIDDEWVGDDDSDVSISQSGFGFSTVYDVFHSDGGVDRYNYLGLLTRETDSNGNITNYSTTGSSAIGALWRKTDEYGNSLTFHHENDLLVRIVDGHGVQYLYEYDDNKNLTTVIYPDLTPDDDTDNPRKVYHYENVDFPNHLTGITDENGDRYATFSYDENGKAISSGLGETGNATGQERVDLDYLEEN